MNSTDARSGNHSDAYLDESASSPTTWVAFALGSLGLLLLLWSTWLGIHNESIPLGAAAVFYLVLIPMIIVLYVAAIAGAIRWMATRRMPRSYTMRSAMTIAVIVSLYALTGWLL